MTNITCPNCENKFPVTDGATDYDWKSSVYYGGVKEAICPHCQSKLTIYAQVTVDIEEVVLNE